MDLFRLTRISLPPCGSLALSIGIILSLGCQGGASVGPVSTASGPTGEDVPDLQLTEDAFWTIPESFSIAGVSGSPDGQVLLWSRESPALLLLQEEFKGAQELVLQEGIKPIQASITGAGIEVLADTPPSIRYLRLDGAVDSTRVLPMPGFLIDAVRTNGGWAFLYESDDGAVVLETSQTGPTGNQDYQVSVDIGQNRYGSLSADGDGIIWTGIAVPFEIRVFTGKGDPLYTARPPMELLDSLRLASDQVDFRTWASLAALSLQQGYIQVLADLASDLRVIVIYNREGKLLRTRVIEAPIGFVESVEETKTLLGVRTTNFGELVRYRWRWSCSVEGGS